MSSTPTAALLDALADGSVRVVDLTQPLSEQTPIIQLPPPFENSPPLSRRRLSRYDDAGPAWAWDVLELGEHTGTHFDAPIHWISGRDGKDVASVAPARLVGPAVVVDRSTECALDPGYLLTVADLEDFEAEHGRIPEGAWVLFRSGWDARAQDAEQYLNVGPDGPVTPGADAQAAQWLASERGISGFGVETVGIDAGAAGVLDPAYPVHLLLLGNDRYGLTQLANLGQLPPTGAVIVVAPLKLVGGTGSPARVLALVPAAV
jgi:kynurenine formamidase